MVSAERISTIFDSYLSKHIQFVDYNDTKSDLLEITIGIPQGSILGINDSLEQIQKSAIYIIAPHLQYKETITKFNLATIKDRLDIFNSKLFRNIVDNDSHRLSSTKASCSEENSMLN